MEKCQLGTALMSERTGMKKYSPKSKNDGFEEHELRERSNDELRSLLER